MRSGSSYGSSSTSDGEVGWSSTPTSSPDSAPVSAPRAHGRRRARAWRHTAAVPMSATAAPAAPERRRVARADASAGHRDPALDALEQHVQAGGARPARHPARRRAAGRTRRSTGRRRTRAPTAGAGSTPTRCSRSAVPNAVVAASSIRRIPAAASTCAGSSTSSAPTVRAPGQAVRPRRTARRRRGPRRARTATAGPRPRTVSSRGASKCRVTKVSIPAPDQRGRTQHRDQRGLATREHAPAPPRPRGGHRPARRGPPRRRAARGRRRGSRDGRPTRRARRRTRSPTTCRAPTARAAPRTRWVCATTAASRSRLPLDRRRRRGRPGARRAPRPWRRRARPGGLVRRQLVDRPHVLAPARRRPRTRPVRGRRRRPRRSARSSASADRVAWPPRRVLRPERICSPTIPRSCAARLPWFAAGPIVAGGPL